ncbi:MAG: SRPBCC domain-containing protein [Prolixibacteraceae bacterium]
MTEAQKIPIRIEAQIEASIEKVWEHWTQASHVMQWNAASPDWHCPAATNDLRVGGEFHYEMAAKDQSFAFDFWGTYTEIVKQNKIASTLGDGRKMLVTFFSEGHSTKVIEEFEAEEQNPIEMQRTGWQSILNNFKNYVESN